MAIAKIKTIAQLDKLLSNGDVYIFSIHVTNERNKYILYLYDEFFKYVCECRNLTSFDIRMLRKLYTNLLYYNDEVEQISAIFKK